MREDWDLDPFLMCQKLYLQSCSGLSGHRRLYGLTSCGTSIAKKLDHNWLTGKVDHWFGNIC